MERYNEYKDSGVQWLGEIPSHWEVCKVKHHYKMITGFTPSTGKSKYYSNNSDNTWVTIADMKTKFISESSSHISDLYIKNFKPTIVRKGSLLYSFKLSVGQVAFADKDLYTNEAIASFENNENVCLDFLFYSASLCIIKNANTNIYGAFILNQELIKNATIVYPPFAEQKAIANYLDSATSKIDEAIAQKQKMIDLLNERKQIIINNAVTKGLNPDAPMKDSGVDWIGEIPEHWEVSRIKNVITLLTDYDANGSFSDIAKNCNINNGTPYAWMVRTTDLVNNRVGIVEGNNYCDKKTYDYLAKSSLESGDLLMTKRGNVGMVYVVPECSCPMTLAPNLYLLKTKASDINNRYLMHYLSSTKPKSQLAILNKSTTLGALYKDDVKSLQIVLPPIDEQLLLAQFIDKELDKVDSVISNCNLQISLLQERKQIIINDVVTGKVKVC